VIRIPDCCAMPLNGKVGDVHTCLTCGTVYRRLIQGWAEDSPLVQLAPELNPDPAFRTPGYDGPEGTPWPRHRYEDTLDEHERTGN
jgi:hypothetical protein